MIGLCILGSTGSIGRNTLDVVSRHPGRFRVVALSAYQNTERLYQQCLRFKPDIAVLVDPYAAQELHQKLKLEGCCTEVLVGAAALEEIVCLAKVDYVMSALVGAAGLLPTFKAARARKRILLANKESLVIAGALLMQEVRDKQIELLPVDSEHSAIFQALPMGFKPGLNLGPEVGLNRIVLTASGGPFRDLPFKDFQEITPIQACSHPNWSMGPKISVDSATMMNKGLEVIEAHYLFGVPLEDIEVLIHPQSIVHSLVKYIDGSSIAQLGTPDMRTAITYALSWPQRMISGAANLDLAEVGQLEFRYIDKVRYPCLDLAYQVLRQADTTAPAILNAANEIAVEAFLKGKIKFIDIYRVVAQALEEMPSTPVNGLDHIIAADAETRIFVRQKLGFSAEYDMIQALA